MPQANEARRSTVWACLVELVKLAGCWVMAFTQLKQHGAGLPFLATKSWQVQHADDLSPAGAVYDLSAQNTTLRSETDTIDLPTLRCFCDGMGKFVVGNLYACMLALLFGK